MVETIATLIITAAIALCILTLAMDRQDNKGTKDDMRDFISLAKYIAVPIVTIAVIFLISKLS